MNATTKIFLVFLSMVLFFSCNKVQKTAETESTSIDTEKTVSNYADDSKVFPVIDESPDMDVDVSLYTELKTDWTAEDTELVEWLVGKWFLLRDDVIDEDDFFDIYFDGEKYKYRGSYRSEGSVGISEAGNVKLIKNPKETTSPPYTIISKWEENGVKTILIADEGPLGFYQHE